MKLQILRRCVQLSVVMVALAVAFLSLYAHYRAARVVDDEQLMAGLRGEVMTQWMDPYISELDDADAFLDANKGTLWSMRIMGVDVTDPLAAAEMVAASKSIHWPLLGSIVIPVLLALGLGKVFCSWMCPGYLLFELTGKLRRTLRLVEVHPAKVRFSHANKYIGLLVGLLLVALTARPLFALVYPPAVISRVFHAWVFGTALGGMVILLLTIVVIELLISPRWWCRTMCPGGALYGLLGWSRPVRVKLKTELCTRCRECVPVCEAGINPITQSGSIECDNCGVCIRHCGHKALVYGIGLPNRWTVRRSAPAGTVRAATAVVAWTVLFGCPVARGHHILGLPHYSYKENYPQRPTLEYPATTGPYEVLLTSYPGVPTPGEPANLAFYIKDQKAARVYAEPITVRVLQTSTFGDNVVIMDSTTRTPFDNEYKYRVTFPSDGEYIVELSMEVEGRVEVLPFLMIAGRPTAGASFALAGGFGVVVLFVVIRALQIKRVRRKWTTGEADATLVSDEGDGACND